jgi:hypothetical protein
MKIKTDFSELWEQVDRIVENRLPPEKELGKYSRKELIKELEAYVHNMEPLPNARHNDKEAVMAYQSLIVNKMATQQYTTVEEKEKMAALLTHSNQLLGQFDKPALNNELKSESSHEMEL